MSVVDKYEPDVERARQGEMPLPKGSVSRLPNAIAESIEAGSINRLDTPSFSAHQAAGLMTVISDVSMLFTTRDWGVAGTISTVAGGFAAATIS